MKNYFKTINYNNLDFNINLIKQLLPNNTKICAVTKSDAYGHNARTICRYLYKKVDYFAFSSNYEAVKILKKLSKAKCLIIGPFSKSYLVQAIELNAIVSIENISQLKILNSYARKLRKTVNFHIKVDTGLHRLGIEKNFEYKSIINALDKFNFCKLTGIFSHLGSGESLSCRRTAQQLNEFTKFLEYTPANITKHICNSVNTFTHTDNALDMVRVGLALYGYGNKQLKPVMSVFAKIVAIKKVKKGAILGYGDSHIATKNMEIAIINIGYGQGLPRNYTNNGFVLINDCPAPIVANICMDMTFVDISNIKGVKVGSYATILGETQKLNAETIATLCDTIPYEILTNFKSIPIENKPK